jgi:hypothetical protein
MATKEQCDFFRSLYEEEERRYGQLEARAKLYLSVIAIFLATITLKLPDVQASVKILQVPFWPFLVEAALLAAALVFVVLGAFIREYEGIADPNDVVDGFGDTPPSNETFFDDRIADYVVATTRNSKVNDRSARYLLVSVSLLAAAMLLLMEC